MTIARAVAAAVVDQEAEWNTQKGIRFSAFSSAGSYLPIPSFGHPLSLCSLFHIVPLSERHIAGPHQHIFIYVSLANP